MLWTIYARVYDGLLRFWPYRHLLDLVEAELDLYPNVNLLDLGSGTGNMVRQALVHKPALVVGVDVTPAMIRAAEKKLARPISKGTVVFENRDLLQFLLKQPSDTFDRIVSINVLYAIEDQETLWKEILRVLKPEGKVVATTSTKKGGLPIIREHLQNSSPLQLLHPRLLAVFIIDCIIALMGASKRFPFYSEPSLRKSIERAGGKWISSRRCYGGSEVGVNVLFSVGKAD